MAIWRVSNYYKKCVEEHERFVKDGKYLIRKTGWRFGTWSITTSDDQIPNFDWQPDSDPEHACVNMNDCTGSNIEEVELIETWDGCWDDYEYDENLTEEEIAEIDNVMEEEGFWELENQGWYPDDCECYVWGPIQIENSAGDTVAIVCSDAEGNTVSFKEVEEPNDEITFDELQLHNQSEQEVINSMPEWPFSEPNEQKPLPKWPFPTGKDDKEIE
jgi:hypothetical protein